ncbi:pancreatic progenitor cell differentiation and proliferation factor-like protein [Latimeria chalumnae]|uniref:pancreatic progenitor cell differentiation and proliferation factor-like protein n=1 Tax=Latimeria chalumnae TaxID=7897 RepID=UPI0003C19F0F|nr:PREDICTED: pancreatic progenitor cell differentiation and proliferation factor-like protein [Latimeria chalumnae]|eukprot:XP_005998544.1 PREDICTED: pancreatic progenitor cell differentiation and proliferation factor-like protein [Latimeria chalumnae]
MASVPSAGCLLAKNQYYRQRRDSASSISSSGSSCCDHVKEKEKTHHGLPGTEEHCWWLKNFFHCETVVVPASDRVSLSTGR